MSDFHADLEARIADGTARIGVIGLGYVGLPLACLFSERFRVVGFDVDAEKVAGLQAGRSHVLDVADGTLAASLARGFEPTTNPESLASCDFIVIAVPTPLTHAKEPDLSAVVATAELLASRLRRGQFVILESTTYPGTTEEVLRPVLEHGGLVAGADFGLAHSPERVDPGNTRFTTRNTPKLVGGLTPACTSAAAKLYGSILEAAVIEVSNPRVAEAAKVYENIFRVVNIALVNEMALIFEKLGIDTWEVVRAASTKPFGFMAFWPGPGVGGHCIPLDPHYLSYRAKRAGVVPKFIELSSEVNDFMRMHVVNLLDDAFAAQGRGLRGSTVAVCGLAYKADVDDTRESQAASVIKLLVHDGARVRCYDSHAANINTDVGRFSSEESLKEALDGADAAIFLTDHTEFKSLDAKSVESLLRGNAVVVDARNLFRTEDFKHARYLGVGKANGARDVGPRGASSGRGDE